MGFQAESREVSLRGLGGIYNAAFVELERTSSGRPEQRTRRGKRDVRRFEVPKGQREIIIRVFKEARWHIADEDVDGTEERRAELLGHELIPPAEIPGTRRNEDAAARLKVRAEAIAASEAAGQVGVWEWCRSILAADDFAKLRQLPPEKWGTYLESQNAEIEEAFCAGKQSAKVVIGIRTFEIVFENGEFAKQVDHKMKKRRHVRRRLVSPQERDGMFKNVVPSNEDVSGDEERECAICCST